MTSARTDKAPWTSRVFKTRLLAGRACGLGGIHARRQPADMIRIRSESRDGENGNDRFWPLTVVFLLGMLGGLLGCAGSPSTPSTPSDPISHTASVDENNSAGWAGTSVDAWIAAASASLGTSGGTIQIAPGAYTVPASIHAVNNVSIQCDSAHGSTLTASPTLTVSLYVAASVANFGLSNCVLDGDAPANPAQSIMISLTNATGGAISNNIIRNTAGFGVYMFYGNSSISISGNEIFNVGTPLPGFNQAIGAGGYPGGGNSHIVVQNNDIHDVNLGICLQPSSVASNISEDWDITNNTITKTSLNGITIYCGGVGTNAPVRTVSAVGNEVSCVGWPANGTGFDSACVPGRFQTGPYSSPDGTGVSYNCATEEQGLISNNRLHDNFFEGIDVTPQLIAIVNTGSAGGCGGPTSLCWVSGDTFLSSQWTTHQSVFVNSIAYSISSCSDSTHCTLETSPGDLAGALLLGNAMRSQTTVTGNVIYGNGHGNYVSSGNGGADVLGYRDSWSGNISYENNAFGFVDQGAVSTSHTGEQTYNNDLSGGFQQGIQCTGCLNPQWVGILGYDSSEPPKETNVALFDPDTYGGYLCNITTEGTTTAFIDLGTDDITNCKPSGSTADSGMAVTNPVNSGAGSKAYSSPVAK
jgi:hypothetical protein